MYRLEHEGWDFLLHGVFCLLVFSNLTYTGYMHFYGKNAQVAGTHTSAAGQLQELILRVLQLLPTESMLCRRQTCRVKRLSEVKMQKLKLF